MAISERQLAVLQNLTREQQQRRIEDIAVLLTGGFGTGSAWQKGYSPEEIEQAQKLLGYSEEEIKGEIRSMDIKTTTGIGANRGTTGLKAKVDNGFTLQDTIIERVNNDKMLSKCLNKVSLDNTGLNLFPVINDTLISYVECRAIEIEREFKTSQFLVNATPDYETKVKTILDLAVNKEIENKVAIQLNTIAPNGSTLEDLVANIDNKYIDQLFIMCNEIDYKKLVKLKDNTGKNYIEFEKNSDGVIVAKYGDIEVIVNNTMENVVLFNPAFIGISHAASYALDLDIITTALVRSGQRLDRLIIGANACILESKAISSITLA